MGTVIQNHITEELISSREKLKPFMNKAIITGKKSVAIYIISILAVLLAERKV